MSEKHAPAICEALPILLHRSSLTLPVILDQTFQGNDPCILFNDENLRARHTKGEGPRLDDMNLFIPTEYEIHLKRCGDRTSILIGNC